MEADPQTPKNPDLTPFRGDLAAQTTNVMDAIKVTLSECGLELGDVVRATVWLSDIKHMQAFNEIYNTYFNGHLPARSCVQASLSGGVDVEVEITAWRSKE